MTSPHTQVRSHSGSAKLAGPFRIYWSARVLLAVVCLLAYASQSEAGLKIYYLRHAEAGHNVVKEWANVPKAQRPAYVGNDSMFTPKGKTQVAAATEKLQKYHFDFIAVSSMWRARNTVLPYLKATGAKAEIWPELHEFSGGTRILSTNLPPPSSQILNAGPRVKLPPAEAPYFSLCADDTNDFKLPRVKGDEQQAAYKFVVQHEIDMILKRFGGTDKTILLVGHANSGKALLKMLTGNKLGDLPPSPIRGFGWLNSSPTASLSWRCTTTPHTRRAASHPPDTASFASRERLEGPFTAPGSGGLAGGTQPAQRRGRKAKTCSRFGQWDWLTGQYYFVAEECSKTERGDDHAAGSSWGGTEIPLQVVQPHKVTRSTWGQHRSGTGAAPEGHGGCKERGRRKASGSERQPTAWPRPPI